AFTAIYFHTAKKPWMSGKAYVIAGIAMLAVNRTASFGRIAYRNFRLTSLAVVQNITYRDGEGNVQLSTSDAMYLHLQPTRPWIFRGGQFVYLRFTDISWNSVFQSHPFYISWWYKDRNGNGVGVCIVERKCGLTQKLSLVDKQTNERGTEARVLIEGPYGKILNLDGYETILLFATGIGIAGLVSIVAELFEHSGNSTVETRRVALFWELDSDRKFSKSLGKSRTLSLL
ncbi:MAG: NADPH oxidase family protein, partial [Nitrososphaerales archaeon]